MTARSQARRRKGANAPRRRPPQPPSQERPGEDWVDVGAYDAMLYWRKQLRDPLFVYAITEHDANDDRRDAPEYVKIGKAVDPIKRLRTLQCGNPRRLGVDGLILATDDLEQRMHHAFRQVHVGGEWFGHGLTLAIRNIVWHIGAEQLKAHRNGMPITEVTNLGVLLLREWCIQPGDAPIHKRRLPATWTAMDEADAAR